MGQSLDPVYRFSLYDGAITRHVYAIGDADRQSVNLAVGWALDGVEGYVYPASIPQPAGTIPIYRSVKTSTVKYMLVPSMDQPIWEAREFFRENHPNTPIVRGYAFLNGPIFTDVPYGSFGLGEIEALFHTGITSGCNATNYCPTALVPRVQMAIFATRSRHGPLFIPPEYASTYSVDVPSNHAFKNWIMQATYDGTMQACSPNAFCPDALILRNEMAMTLLRIRHGSTYSPPPPGPRMFDDVEPNPVVNPWAPWIHQLSREGITSGCNATNYCPTAGVSRDAMAIFLSRTLRLQQ